jgi:hypothetical protein
MQSSSNFFGAESLSLIGALTLAVGVLWRALQAKDLQCDTLIRETLLQTETLRTLTAALDRLRAEGCGNASHGLDSRDQPRSMR